MFTNKADIKRKKMASSMLEEQERKPATPTMARASANPKLAFTSGGKNFIAALQAETLHLMIVLYHDITTIGCRLFFYRAARGLYR
jgi:hypothetical protein